MADSDHEDDFINEWQRSWIEELSKFPWYPLAPEIQEELIAMLGVTDPDTARSVIGGIHRCLYNLEIHVKEAELKVSPTSERDRASAYLSAIEKLLEKSKTLTGETYWWIVDEAEGAEQPFAYGDFLEQADKVARILRDYVDSYEVPRGRQPNLPLQEAMIDLSTGYEHYSGRQVDWPHRSTSKSGSIQGEVQGDFFHFFARVVRLVKNFTDSEIESTITAALKSRKKSGRK